MTASEIELAIQITFKFKTLTDGSNFTYKLLPRLVKLNLAAVAQRVFKGAFYGSKRARNRRIFR